MKRILPGTCHAYVLQDGDGDRYLTGGQLATVIARHADTGGLLEAVVVSGRRESTFPLHLHPQGHEAMIVLDGRIDLRLGANRYLLSRGDYASIPPGTPHGYRIDGPYARVLAWTVNGSAARLQATLGEPAGEATGPGEPAAWSAERQRRAEAAADVRFVTGDRDEVASIQEPAATAPDDVSPYALREGSGERLLAGDQLFTFLATQANTAGAFIALTTVGPKGTPIPRHFHEKHTETFFCLDGRMTMWGGDEEVTLHRGDFLHAPAGTIHAYRLDAPLTRFVGFLAPGLFEPFFRTICDPCEDEIFPVTPGPVRFDRVMQKIQELDLKLIGPPRSPAHG